MLQEGDIKQVVLDICRNELVHLVPLLRSHKYLFVPGIYVIHRLHVHLATCSTVITVMSPNFHHYII